MKKVYLLFGLMLFSCSSAFDSSNNNLNTSNVVDTRDVLLTCEDCLTETNIINDNLKLIDVLPFAPQLTASNIDAIKKSYCANGVPAGMLNDHYITESKEDIRNMIQSIKDCKVEKLSTGEGIVCGGQITRIEFINKVNKYVFSYIDGYFEIDNSYYKLDGKLSSFEESTHSNSFITYSSTIDVYKDEEFVKEIDNIFYDLEFTIESKDELTKTTDKIVVEYNDIYIIDSTHFNFEHLNGKTYLCTVVSEDIFSFLFN